MSKLLKMLGAVSNNGEPFIQSVNDLLISIIVSLILAGIMMLCYKLCHDSLTYNRKFNITLLMLSLSATILMALIENNPMFSLGALGALSICRIRTNTHDPRDLGFVFWSIMIGISSALGAFTTGITGSVVLFAVIMIFKKFEHIQKYETIIVRGKKEALSQVHDIFTNTVNGSLLSENIFLDSFELVFELDTDETEKASLINRLNFLDGVTGVNVLAPQTEVA